MNTEAKPTAAPGGSRAPRRWTRHPALFALGGLAFLFLGYALLSGPAVWLMQHRVLPTETVERYFLGPQAPLTFVLSMVPGGEAALHVYIGQWESMSQ